MRARLSKTRWLDFAAVTAIALALICFAASALGYRSGALSLPSAFLVLRASGVLGFLALVIAGVASVRSERRGVGFAALLISVLFATFCLLWIERARSVPRIHDISTDLSDPPAFSAILPLRASAPNPAAYGGAAVAEQQRRAYPDIQPLTATAAPAKAFGAADRVARAMHWEIVAENPAQGRIEATDTTRIFGFKDDVVIRLTPAGSGTRVDVRSVSRVGLSDVGTNARRIRHFLGELQEELKKEGGA